MRSTGPVRIVFSSKTISFDPLATEASYPEGEAPEDLVQLDTLHLRLQSDDRWFQFSVRDALSRWDCARAYRTASSFTAACFLEYMERKFPFPIRSIQIDGGSEFKKHFEQACRDRSIRLFMTPPRSPKLQYYIERSNRVHREEFYEVEDIAIRLDEHNQQLERWNQTYNYLRPHQSLAQLTLNIIETGLNAIKLPGITNVLDEYIGLTSRTSPNKQG